MFKVLVFLSLVALGTSLPAAQSNQKKSVKDAIGEKPENLREQRSKMEASDIDNVLSNDRILSNYLKCSLNKGPCTSEARNVKDFIQLLIESRCAKCDPEQRKIIKKFMLHVKNRKPKEYQELIKLYDPEGTQITELEKFLSTSR